ncbi:hypothetical protein INT43_000853 [Umbelopsis isabellina]|uniref:Complex 1 LYR protein domain-containing protein n=1 Tax=Mortierella isabellina TaxID=91625 RepID=A0A8H7UJ14_MORIS|nr:hypothetical protein INT43_000853 [Umbelopsis isabellina]
MNVPPVWQAYCKLRPSLAFEIPFKTRVLYRSLLRESAQFNESKVCTFLRTTIRERFRFHKHETSARRALITIQEGQRVCVKRLLKRFRPIVDIGFFNKALKVMRAALEGNDPYYRRIEAMANAEIGPLAFVKKKICRIANPAKRHLATLDIRPQSAKSQRPGVAIPLPEYIMQVEQSPSKEANAAELSKRKPYMRAIQVQCATGRKFMRVRGWIQPQKTSMMIKASVMTNQRRVDRIKLYEEYIRLLNGEADFLKELGVDNRDIRDTTQTIRAVLADAYKQFNQPQKGTSTMMKEGNSKHVGD